MLVKARRVASDLVSCPRLPLVPPPSMTRVFTARILSRPPSAAAASLTICCSGVACVQPPVIPVIPVINVATAIDETHGLRFIQTSSSGSGDAVLHAEQRKVDGIGHRLIAGVARV